MLFYHALMNVERYYQRAMQKAGYTPHPAQLEVVAMLDRILLQLCPPRRGRDGWWRRFWRGAKNQRGGGGHGQAVKGLYIWGGVGRGKTFLMDAFYEVLPLRQKARLHFHEFLLSAHERMHALKKHRNAAARVAREYAARYRVLCLDEMHIADEGDAAITQGLLVAMLEGGVTLVTTSNRAPEALNPDPSIRALFRGAVEALREHTTVANLDGGVDYRLRHIERAEVWRCPPSAQANAALAAAFHECNAVAGEKPPFIIVNKRKIATAQWAEGIAWFEFCIICGPPRARIDYIEIARMFHTVLIQDIPVLNNENNEHARRFNLLIDALYDHNVKLLATAARPPTDLYQGTRLSFEFQRTSSRLLEMRSHEYWAREHRV